MFVGTMSLAYAMEHVRLHRRLALLVLKYVGSSIMWYVLYIYFLKSNGHLDSSSRSMAGLMGVTAFLSMWINNTASANIMIPTALAIVNELEKYRPATGQKDRTIETGKKSNSTEHSSVLTDIVIAEKIPETE